MAVRHAGVAGAGGDRLVLGRHLSERFLAWVSIRFLPDGRLRRNFMAIITVAVTVFTTSIALEFAVYVFIRVQPLPVMLEDFAEGFNRLGFSAR